MQIAFFHECMANNRPYWGNVIRTIASPLERLSVLADLVRRLDPGDGELRILEIGSFAGASAVVLARSVRKYHAGAGKIFCVDPWCFNVGNTFLKQGVLYDKQGRDLASYTYEDMFRHNIRAAGVEKLVVTVKGFSREVLPLLANERFDLIYVDGDHSHAGASFDIATAMHLVRPGGFLCGDDLEIQASDMPPGAIVDYDLSGRFAKYNDQEFHPGVTLALHEAFHRKISAVEGVWAQKKIKDSSLPGGVSWMDVEDIAKVKPDWVSPIFANFFNFILLRFQQVARENKWEVAVIYGAGKHTRRLLDFLNQTDCFPVKLSGVVDDFVSDSHIGLLPILTRKQTLQLKPDVIILSSDACEDALYKAAADWRRDIPVFRLYGTN